MLRGVDRLLLKGLFCLFILQIRANAQDPHAYSADLLPEPVIGEVLSDQDNTSEGKSTLPEPKVAPPGEPGPQRSDISTTPRSPYDQPIGKLPTLSNGQDTEAVPAIVRPRAPHLPNAYYLGPGDMLAIIVHGVFGSFANAPVYFPKAGQDFLPATGYPVQVDAKGNLNLPSIEPVQVVGLTVAQARRAIEDAYLKSGALEQRNRTMLSLLRKRTTQVTLIHDDRSRGYSRVDKVALPRDQANILGALTAGGEFDPRASVRVLKPVLSGGEPGQLADGSIVQVKSPEVRYFTAGGLLAGGQHALPTDRPLTALQAIALAGGYRQRIIPHHTLIIVRNAGRSLHIPVRELLRNPAAYTIHAGDHLIVR